MAFHPYPQLIPSVFNPSGFGPPRRLTVASTWPWIDHFASGLGHATESPYSDSLSLRLPHHGLTSPLITNSQAHSSKGTLSQLLRLLQRFVSKRFQVLFHSPPGVLFTFPSRYLSAIGHLGVFRLTRWSWQIHTGFLGPRDTWDPFRLCTTFRLRDWHPLWSAFQCRSPISRKSTCTSAEVREGPTTPTMQRLPAITHDRFGLFRVRSPLLTESLLFSLPVGTEMFHFPTFPLPALYIQAGVIRSYKYA